LHTIEEEPFPADENDQLVIFVDQQEPEQANLLPNNQENISVDKASTLKSLTSPSKEVRF
jgi:hypothetical protein